MDDYTYREAYRAWAVEAALCRMRGEAEPVKPVKPAPAPKPRGPRKTRVAKPAKRRGCPCRLSPGRCFRCNPLRMPPQKYESPYKHGRWRERVAEPTC